MNDNIMCGETYVWVWTQFHKPENRDQARRWYPEPPPPDEVIYEEMFNKAFELNEHHWLIHSSQPQQFIVRVSTQKTTKDVVRHVLRANHSSMLNQLNSVTQAKYNDCPVYAEHKQELD